ncbi:hypothetical protein PIB30_052884 [Stylosanthes scabra]|uniref:Uncharacterized protein n=1 Tax=Stylosanthes scabra TaxID=79078 RepID=A0ABU6YIY8_9FABA|nr:hypothetical protein [Stylosanthes scabra]
MRHVRIFHTHIRWKVVWGYYYRPARVWNTKVNVRGEPVRAKAKSDIPRFSRKARVFMIKFFPLPTMRGDCISVNGKICTQSTPRRLNLTANILVAMDSWEKAEPSHSGFCTDANKSKKFWASGFGSSTSSSAGRSSVQAC